MTLDDLINLARARLDDTKTPYLWSDDDLTDYANAAVREACDRAWLLYDSYTPSVCEIHLSAAQDVYDLHPSIQSIQRATLRARATRIAQVNERDIGRDLDGEQWWNMTGIPTSYFIHRDTITVYPTPSESDVLDLHVYRRPLSSEELKDSTDVPVIPEQYHRQLVHWMLHEAYQKNDSDVMNAKASDAAAVEFIRAFGSGRSAKFDRWRRESPQGREVYGRRMGG